MNIGQINYEMSKWPYGYVANDVIYLDTGQYDFFKDYAIMSQDDIEKYHIGTCWDLSLYIHKICRENNIFGKLFYIQSDHEDTHMWFSFEQNHLYAFESAYKNYAGIHDFLSYEEMFYQYATWCMNDWNANQYFIVECNSNVNLDNCQLMLPEDFMNYVLKNSNYVFGDAFLYEQACLIDWRNNDWFMT